MIQLTRSFYIAQGTNRACYIHPNDDTKCIKVTISNDNSESKKETKYYKFLKKRISWEHISKYHGSVETDLGIGEVYDLIKDYDGTVSKTLHYYIRTDHYNHEWKRYRLLLDKLQKYTLKNKIILKDLNTKNIAMQRIAKNNMKLVIIDGISNNDFLYYSNYSNYFSEKRINKQWQKFIKKNKRTLYNKKII